MWEEILFTLISNGLWAVLSCCLLGYLLKDSKKREAKFTDIIEDLAERLKIINQIQSDVKSLTGKVDVLTVKNSVERAIRSNNSDNVRQKRHYKKAVVVGED
ncbi:MAG: BhlA/UviB family holin-like peptide [Firmicutes bacterium]|nr:BhlA/UviB family holin-like peptide [Bacillota bacterium]